MFSKIKRFVIRFVIIEYASEDQDQSLADYDPEMDFANADMESSPDDVTQSPRSDDFAKPQFSRDIPSDHVTPKPRRGKI